MSKTVLFQTIQFSISTQFSSIWPIDITVSGSTTMGQSGHGSDGNEEVLCISLSSSITGTSPSDCLVSYLGHSLRGGGLTLCKEAVSVFDSSSQLANGNEICLEMIQSFDINENVAKLRQRRLNHPQTSPLNTYPSIPLSFL